MFVCLADNNEIEEFLPTQIQIPLFLLEKLVSLWDLNSLCPFACVCVWADMSKPKDDFWHFLHCSPRYLLIEGLLLNPLILAGLAGQHACWAFIWVLRAQTLVPKLVHQMIYALSHLPVWQY